MSIAGTALVGIQGLLGIAELFAGGTKLAGAESQVETFDHLGYPQWFRLLTGGFEVLAGAALLVSFFVTPILALVGSLVAIGVLAGAVVSHVRAGDAPGQMVPASVLLVIAIVVGWSRLGAIG